MSQSDFRSRSVDLSGMVRAIVEQYRQANPERDVSVTIQEGIIVQGDPDLLQIALENLIDNAWKFTGKTERPRIEFGIHLTEGKRIYFIRDNGVGFDMAYADKLFGAFQRLHRAGEFAGTGIGLATVRRIMTRHGGQVWAEATVGKGATIFFTLPS
jgi:light-regulated signal transduction histidine kinase (bacteriophytochrome)